MKQLAFFLVLITVLLSPVLAAYTVDNAAVTTAAEPIKITWQLIVVVLTSIYEALSRILPGSTHWSIIGRVLQFLTWLSELLNNKKR